MASDKIDRSRFETLEKVLGDRLLLERIDLIPYSYDGTAELRTLPAAVALPESVVEISACLTWAREQKTAVVTRGSGTGLSGGSVPSPGCLVLCLTAMNKVLEIDPANLTIRVQPGVITADIDRLAAEHGLFYPPDPGSMKISTIGGNVAENSGGLRGLKYGVTRDYVMAIQVVMPDGTVTRLGSACVKDVAGYSMKDLFVGSEGTLGVITEILLRLLPRPAARRTMLASFQTMEGAAAAVSKIIAAQIIPCTLEFIDQVTLRCVEDYTRVGLPVDAGAILLIETDGHPAAVEEEIAAMEKVVRDNGADEVRIATSEVEAAELASARRQAFSALARVRPTTILEDVTVPRSKLVAMVGAINEIAGRYQLQVGTFGHMGDGNLHPTILTDERDEEEMKRVHEALGEIADAAIALGGTVTGEHGVGLAKKKYLERQLDEGSFALMRNVKRTLDPSNLLNPGKIFDLDPS